MGIIPYFPPLHSDHISGNLLLLHIWNIYSNCNRPEKTPQTYVLTVLSSSIFQTLKRKEKEYEHDMERLAREKIATQQRLSELKNELSQWMDVIEIDRILRQSVQPEEDQASTSTASGRLTVI